YVGLESLGSANQATAASKSAGAKWQSIFPGIAVNVTVEGPYQNLRHFVRDIEASKAFVVINAIELERAAEAQAQQGAAKSANAPVSLRLDLATYFQRTAQPDQAADQRPARN